MLNSTRIAAIAGALFVTSLPLAAVSQAADDCGAGQYFNTELNQCVFYPAAGPVGPGPVGPGPVGPGPVGPGPVGPGPVGPGPVGPGPIGPR